MQATARSFNPRLLGTVPGLVCVGLLTLACTQSPATDSTVAAATPPQENPTMPFKASRHPPPDVPPIEHQGVRYEQETQGRRHGLDRTTGYLVAIDPATDERLWTLQVYETSSIDELEADVQWVYFESMSLIEGRDALLIENEDGKRFVVDLQERSVSPAP